MVKRGIVLGGGGSRGSYEVGVWRALRELDIDYQVVTGSSVGSLNGAMMVQGDYELSVDLWNQITTEQIMDADLPDVDILTLAGKAQFTAALTKEVLEKKGVTTSGLERILGNYILADKFFASPVDFGLTTMQVPEMKMLAIKKSQIKPADLTHWLLASSSCFPAFVPHKFNGKSYIDGGYYDNVPINLAHALGAEEVIAVDLKAPGIVRRVSKKKLPITYIKPRFDLGSFTSFQPRLASRNMALGYNDAMTVFGRLEGFGYTFFPGEAKRAQRDILPQTLQSIRLFLPEDNAPVDKMVRSYLKKALELEEDAAEDKDLLYYATYQAGRIFCLDESLIYTFGEFNRRLMTEAAKDKLKLQELGISRVPLKERIVEVSQKLPLIKDLDRGIIVILLEEILQEIDEGEAEAVDVLLHLLTFGREVVAAAYLHAIKDMMGGYLLPF